MIGPTGAVRVLVATRPVDFRKGAEGLAALVREVMHADPFDGAVYVFRATNGPLAARFHLPRLLQIETILGKTGRLLCLVPWGHCSVGARVS